MRERNRQSAFTLIELLMSLSILSIIMVIVLGGLRIGVRAWEKGERVLSMQQRSRTILDQLARQLTSAEVLMSAQKQQPLVTFAGTSRAIEFTSSLPLITKTQSGPVHVKYVVETGPDGKKRLLLHEKNITTDDYLSETQLGFETDAHVLIGALEELHFEFSGEGPIPIWSSAWRFKELTDLPRAVRITFRDEKGRDHIRVIARIHQWDRFRDSEAPG